MSNSKTIELEKQVKEEMRCELGRVLRKGAHEMLIKYIQDEVADYIGDNADERDQETGRREYGIVYGRVSMGARHGRSKSRYTRDGHNIQAITQLIILYEAQY